jgi:acetyl-CoA carboxylase carboxyltransferase component
MNQLKSKINIRSEDFKINQQAMQTLVDDLKNVAQHIALGGGEVAREKHLARGKLLPRERIDHLIDPGTAFLEIGQLAAYKVYQDDIPAAGVIAGVGLIHGVACMIVANDATVKGGTYYPLTVKNIYVHRKLPSKTIYLVFIWSIQVALIFHFKMKCSRIAITLAVFSTIKPVCRAKASLRLLS